MNTNHAKAIKGMGIANIVIAALGILGMLVCWAMLGVGGTAVSGSGYDYFYTDDGLVIDAGDLNMLLGMLGFLVFWMLICFAIVLIAGIMSVRGAAKPEKLKGVMIWNIIGAIAGFIGAGIVSLVLCVISAVFASKDKNALAAAPAYAAPQYAPVAPTMPQQPYTTPAASTAPVTPATAAASIPTGSPVTPTTPIAAQSVTPVAPTEPASATPSETDNQPPLA